MMRDLGRDAIWFDYISNPADLTPALLAREILLRGRHVTGRRMTAFLCICIALAISAGYELIEWCSALLLGQGADEFLGTQGDPWDTQSDMFLALLGADGSDADTVRALARELLGDEAVVRLVFVERANDVVAIPPRVLQGNAAADSRGVGIVRDVKPVARPALAEGRRPQQPIDQRVFGVP